MKPSAVAIAVCYSFGAFLLIGCAPKPQDWPSVVQPGVRLTVQLDAYLVSDSIDDLTNARAERLPAPRPPFTLVVDKTEGGWLYGKAGGRRVVISREHVVLILPIE
jgi:hypothetical protein